MILLASTLWMWSFHLLLVKAGTPTLPDLSGIYCLDVDSNVTSAKMRLSVAKSARRKTKVQHFAIYSDYGFQLPTMGNGSMDRTGLCDSVTDYYTTNHEIYCKLSLDEKREFLMCPNLTPNAAQKLLTAYVE